MLSVTPEKTYMGRLPYGVDLQEELNRICRVNKIKLGRVEAIGAVKKARLGYYDQSDRSYRFVEREQRLEILNLTGNVSIKDGEPFVHAHLTLGDHAGLAFGGHLMPGTIVFACEVIVQKYGGKPLERGFDEQTGLPLWSDSALSSS
ncbi:MAG: DNA-binding protein [Magnetococcales bacterium]|nr:DNA-binding protein [Magnetococcales bacterium]